MGTLLNRFREVVAKSKDPRMKSEGEFNVLYPTGFPCFDFINGCKVHVDDKKNGKRYSYYSLGVTDGSCCMLIGRSGCGKTTFAIQMAANIVRPFPEAEIFHDDIEGGTTESRKRVLTKFNDEDLQNRYRYRNTGITAENFYETLKTIKDIKLENYDEYSYDTGLLDPMGNKVTALIPTVYILDSIALLMPEKYTDEEELSGQMSATAAARTNSSVFKRIIPMLKAANIILVMINHINDVVNINPMQMKKASLSYLKPDESLVGGKVITYLTNLLLRFDDNSKLKPEEGLHIDGSLVDIQIVKSRSGKAGSVCTLVFDKANGFDSDLSLYILLKNAKMINGAGAYLYIGDRKDKSFRQSELKNKLATDPEFAEIFINTAIEILKTKVNDTPDFLNNSENTKSISDTISSTLGVMVEE